MKDIQQYSEKVHASLYECSFESLPLCLLHKKGKHSSKETVGEFLTHKTLSRLSRAVLVETRVGIRRRRFGEEKRAPEALAGTFGI